MQDELWSMHEEMKQRVRDRRRAQQAGTGGTGATDDKQWAEMLSRKERQLLELRDACESVSEQLARYDSPALRSLARKLKAAAYELPEDMVVPGVAV